MLERIREARKNESGFTLIELLIVIVILGVLAGIVVFAVNGITDDSNKSACKSDVKNVEVAVEAYYAQHRSAGYPTAATVQGLVVPGYLHSWPTGTTITYTPTANSFTVTGSNGGTAC